VRALIFSTIFVVNTLRYFSEKQTVRIGEKLSTNLITAYTAFCTFSADD
jgi:hypothetical protein